MKYKKGDNLEVLLLDHALIDVADDSPLEFYVYGRLVFISDKEIKLAYWMPKNGELDGNAEMVSIIRGAIKKIRKLK